jgi:hypothetical protein
MAAVMARMRRHSKHLDAQQHYQKQAFEVEGFPCHCRPAGYTSTHIPPSADRAAACTVRSI